MTLEEILHGTAKKMKIKRRVLNPDGRSTRSETVLAIDVKPGWKEGTKVTFPREGDQGPDNIPADIIFVIKDKPHTTFTRSGSDLKYTAKISLRQICLLNTLSKLLFCTSLVRLRLVFIDCRPEKI